MAQFIDLLREHVRTPFLSAFAYGSGVFSQNHPIAGTDNKMVDYLVVVEDNELTRWHRQNYQINPQDYPLAGRLAIEHSNLFKESVYYIPDVEVSAQNGRRRRIKYGVVGWEVLRRDLFTWNSLFLAGRLHKPTVKSGVDAIIDGAMDLNLNSALQVALLQLSNEPQIDFNRILQKIVAISYTRDPRLLLAESPKKVENIVAGQKNELEAMYLEKYEATKGWQLRDPAVRMNLLASLPFTLKAELQPSDLWRIALSGETPRLVTEAVGRIVRRSAWRQMALGSISTPIGKAFKYALSKVSKRLK